MFTTIQRADVGQNVGGLDMARKIDRLSALEVARKWKPGLYPDGAGLYLQVTASESRSWVYRYTLDGRPRYMGLGPFPTVSLAEARRKAALPRQQRSEGIDPIKARRDQRDLARLEVAKSITFKDAAERYIEAHKAGWRNAKHAGQWRSTLETYAYPVLGSLPVRGVDVSAVMEVLEPIWNTKTETASRTRGRIESILDWAAVRGYRSGDNPARWRGNLKSLLPERSKVRGVQHFAALPYGQVGAFMQDLRAHDGVAARALELLILTACRTGEVVGTRWNELDLDAAVWTIPPERIKSRLQHRVPLSDQAVAVIEAMQAQRVSERGDGFVFPGVRKGRSLSNMAMLKLLGRMGRSDLTSHGFRSTFRDWTAEQTSYPREVCEAALAHAIPDKVEAAYRRGDLFEKRRRLMNEWARFCDTQAKAGEVVAIGSKKK